MTQVKIDGLYFDILISSDLIIDKVNYLYNILFEKYHNQWPLCLVVLNGASVFAEQLFIDSKLPIQIDQLKVHSYEGLRSKEKISIDYLPYDLIKNRDVLLIEDIVDSGLTLNFLKKELKNHGAKTIECVTLLFKPNKYQFSQVPEHIGFSIGDEFVVGYGMDFNQKGRELKHIYKNTNT